MTEHDKRAVKSFLVSFKQAVAACGPLRLADRPENDQCLIALGLTRANCTDEIMDLSVLDYVSGPDADLSGRGGHFWIFGKTIQAREIYIKLKLIDGVYSEIPLCVSFHFAREHLVFPFKGSP